MVLSGKIVSEFKINIPPRKFYQLLKYGVEGLPKISPLIKKVELLDGDWDTHGHGSTKIWYYVIDNKIEWYKERVEYDDEKMIVSVFGLGGDPFNCFKTFDATIQVVSNGFDASKIIVTMIYEKMNYEVSDPYKYLDIMNGIAKDMEVHLQNLKV